MRTGTPSDEVVIAQVTRWGSQAPTYVIANRLRSMGYNVRTDWVLRQMKRMERAGQVERAPTPYAVMIEWRLSPTPGSGESV